MRRRLYILLVAFTLVVPLGMMTYKLQVLDYPLTGLVPTVSYRVEVNMQMDGHGSDVRLRTFLPRSDMRQTVTDEQNISGVFAFSLRSDQGLNRIASWEAEALRGHQQVRYAYSVQTRKVEYVLPDDITVPDQYPKAFNRYLKAENGIQVDSPLIAEKVNELFPHGETNVSLILQHLHRHLQDEFKNKSFTGFTDALTALKLKEASCNGKGRLFVALARHMGLPARLVGGLILQPGSKRTSHQWVEVYVNGHWVPFDTINDHFAEIPANFLTLYYNDEALFKHSTNINFDYFFKTQKKLVPRADIQQNLSRSTFNLFNIYSTFERIGISQNLLKILLMIPVGALVVVIFRNIIGIQTFGTFLPALIAAAARETGLLWGLVGFVSIIVVSALVRKVLDWVQLLHSPKMAIMLTTVVVVMLLMTLFSVHFGLYDLAHVSLFPIAILAITAERFAILEEEQGLLKALKITFWSGIVICASYLAMDSLFLQSLILAFPETLLVVIALNLWLGKWIGMRVTEFIRFRHLIFKTQS